MPITKNGSSPSTRAKSSQSVARMPATRLITTAIGTAAYGSLRNSGVISRQKNSAERYHIGQCGSAHMSLMFSPPT